MQAGANRVANPYRLGGVRLANLLVHPTAVGLFDATLQQGDLRFDHTVVHPGSSLVGQSLQAAIRASQWKVSVVSIQRDDEIIASPPPTFEIHAGDILLVLGNRERIRAFARSHD
jgi:voltage-gated potassium channel